MTELSPAAQVMIAVTHVYQEHGGDPPARAITAAALRAAAGHFDDGLTTEEYDTGWRAAMDFIAAIADELEAQ